jgi:type I restriction enzyme, S subunit
MFEQEILLNLFEIPQRNGLTKPKRLRGEGVKMVNMGELFSQRRIYDLSMDRVPCSEKELAANKLERGDLLFARQSLTLEGAGKCSIFLGDEEDVVFESHLIRCRLDKSKVNPLYYFYFFESKFGKQRIASIVEQVAAAGIRGSDLIKLSVFIPPISAQDAIAHILGALDDKIEVNQKMNQTLEEIAKAIFKSWFIDFDPVHAKAEGRPTGLSQGISDLFPDELVDSEVGQIPKGWSESTVEDLCDYVSSGGTPARRNPEYWENGEVEWFKTGELLDSPLLDAKEKITNLGIEKSAAKIWDRHTILFAIYASPTVGRLGYLTRPGACNQAAAGLSAKYEVGMPFLYWTLFHARRELQHIAVGAAQQNINLKILKTHKCLKPPTGLTAQFSKSGLLIEERREFLAKENKVLSELRDALLPKLISGELRVPDAEKFLEEAGV